MNPFAAFRERERKAHDLARLAHEAKNRELEARHRACFDEMITVLEKHRCEMQPVLRYLPIGFVPDVQIEVDPPMLSSA